MSFVLVFPNVLGTAATDLAGIGWALSAANAAAASHTTTLLTAAEDEVSAAIAAVFSAHAQGYQALSARAAAFHSELVQSLTASAGAYAAAEAAAASPLHSLLGLINAPIQAATGRP